MRTCNSGLRSTTRSWRRERARGRRGSAAGDPQNRKSGNIAQEIAEQYPGRSGCRGTMLWLAASFQSPLARCRILFAEATQCRPEQKIINLFSLTSKTDADNLLTSLTNFGRRFRISLSEEDWQKCGFVKNDFYPPSSDSSPSEIDQVVCHTKMTSKAWLSVCNANNSSLIVCVGTQILWNRIHFRFQVHLELTMGFSLSFFYQFRFDFDSFLSFVYIFLSAREPLSKFRMKFCIFFRLISHLKELPFSSDRFVSIPIQSDVSSEESARSFFDRPEDDAPQHFGSNCPSLLFILPLLRCCRQLPPFQRPTTRKLFQSFHFSLHFFRSIWTGCRIWNGSAWHLSTAIIFWRCDIVVYALNAFLRFKITYILFFVGVQRCLFGQFRLARLSSLGSVWFSPSSFFFRTVFLELLGKHCLTRRSLPWMRNETSLFKTSLSFKENVSGRSKRI